VVLQVGSSDLTQKASTSESVGNPRFMPDRKPICAIVEVVDRYIIPRIENAVRTSASVPVASKDEDEERFRENMVFFREVASRCQSDGARLVVLHTPDRNEVARNVSHPTRYEDHREEFLKLCEELHVPVVNLAVQWRNGPIDAAEYFRDDVHPNPAGNRAIAAAVALEIP
jgi:lysophospholipase L1-like esterase